MAAAAEQLELEAEPRAVSYARRWLRDRLGTWSPEGVESAELLVSELVTNAVLHGRRPITLTAGIDGAQLVVEVVDRSASLPVLNHYGASAPTGRGLVLIDGLAHGWGVRRFPGGKGVWAVLRDGPIPEGRAGETEDTERGAPEPAWPPPPDVTIPATTAAELAHPDLVEVHILGLPLAVYDAARQHNDAVMREFRWLIGHETSPDVPRRLIQLADEVQALFGSETEGLRRQIADAKRRGAILVDLEMKIPRVGWEHLTRLAHLLDEADEFCERGDLLTLSTPLQLRRFRSWYLAEVLSQLAGSEPTPWPPAWGTTVEATP